MKVHEKRSQAHSSADEEKVIMTRKQKAESKAHEAEQQSPNKKPKSENENGQPNGKSEADIAAEFEEFSKAIREHLSVQQMREILEANDQDSSGTDTAIVTKWLV